MKPILAVMIGWRLMIDVPALTRRSFYRPLLRSLRLHATDGTLEHGFQQLPFCVTGTTTGPVAVAGNWPSASICAAISCALASRFPRSGLPARSG